MLDPNQIILLKEAQKESIKNKFLNKDQLGLAYAEQLFNLWVPAAYGGREESLPTGLKTLEELAYIDGGYGWTVTLCAGANMFAGFLAPALAKAIFKDPKVCWGGSGRTGGKALWNGKEYLISGQWQYATGAPHLTHFTFNAEIWENGQPVLEDDGSPKVRSFFIPRDQVLIHYDWSAFGLECTASHNFSLNNAIVPKENEYLLDPIAKTSDSPLFAIPFMPFAEITLLVNYIGMFRRFLDLVERYYFEKAKDAQWAEKWSKQRFQQLDSIQTDFTKQRAKAFALADSIWEQVLAGLADGNATQYDELATFARQFVKEMREQLIQLFPLLGIRAAQVDHEINIVFRNIFTASQHSLLNI